jgi:hypothetical protein
VYAKLVAIFITVTAVKAFAQPDTLNVYLEKSEKHRFGVNLVFENNSSDTIFLGTRFHNFSLRDAIPHYSGICINYHYNNYMFRSDFGDVNPPMFIF